MINLWPIKQRTTKAQGEPRNICVNSIYLSVSERIRRIFDITVLMYKVKHGLVPDCVSELFVRKGSTHTLRNSDFVLPRFETIRYGKHSVRYLGPFLWSKLADSQRDSPNLSVFINKMRKLNLADIVINNSNCCNLCSQ